jgi:predicted alpha/beta-fold hydrolase
MQIESPDANARLSATSTYAAPWWLPGGDLQTIYAYAFRFNDLIEYRRERWETPDGDFIDLDFVDSNGESTKLLVLFHGLEGCSRSHYALATMARVGQLGWRGVVPHFRGCSGEANRLPRSYHSGDSAEIDWILRRLKSQNPHCDLYVVGVSLGGNMLLKWLAESGQAAREIVRRAAAISAPMDLSVAAQVLDFGYRKIIYTRTFLRSLRQKVLRKITAYRIGIDIENVLACSTFRAIDNLYTAPFHGFADAEDYWTRSSSKPLLRQIQVPTLLLNARNDPFLPQLALPTRSEVSDSVLLEYPASGGHVGFVSGPFPGSLDWLPRRIVKFFSAEQL